MVWFYYTPDSTEVIAFVFDYVDRKGGIRKVIKKKVQAGDYHLIMIMYKPAYLHEHMVDFTGR